MNLSTVLPAVESDSCVSPRIHAAGSNAILFDPAKIHYSAEIQQRLIALSQRIAEHSESVGSQELVLGVNNLLFIFNPLELHPEKAKELVIALWETTEATKQSGREIEIPVTYGGAAGEDLLNLAASLSIGVHEYVQRHSAAIYTVACIGSMPGFAYMTGLPADLAVPRRKIPRMKVEVGTVIIGGSQAGIMPCTAPSGWHLLGKTEVEMFDPHRGTPCSLAPGDQVKFVVKGIEA